jgi:hypothetical protein
VGPLGKQARPLLYDGLVQRGLLVRRGSRLLGILPRTSYPVADAGRVRVLRAELQAALLHGVEPTQRIAAVIAVLSAVGCAHEVIDLRGQSRRTVRKRADAIAHGDWAADGVRAAVRAAQAAVTGAVVVASIGG